MESPKIDDLDYERYFINIEDLTEILRDLSRNYCKDNCPISGIIKCCGYDHHKHSLPETILNNQESEAISKGWIFHNEEDRCRYHSDSGCSLTKTISPICIGYFCSDLTNYLTNNSKDKELMNEFLESIGIVRMSSRFDYQFNRINYYLEDTIQLGRKILENSK
ncbi:MAG: hypothetical protein WC867_06080 [Candidatus Pacearchaeota archaeon]|jgi:hypothetical protein